MKEYQIIVKKNNIHHQLTKGMIADYHTIKLAFSWQAFFFNFIWFLFHGMWKSAFTLILSIAIINILYINLEIKIAISFFIAMLVGIKANQHYVNFLIKNHEFLKEDLIIAKNRHEAEYKSLKLLMHNYPDQANNLLELTIEGCGKLTIYKSLTIFFSKLCRLLKINR